MPAGRKNQKRAAARGTRLPTCRLLGTKRVATAPRPNRGLTRAACLIRGPNKKKNLNVYAKIAKEAVNLLGGMLSIETTYAGEPPSHLVNAERSRCQTSKSRMSKR